MRPTNPGIPFPNDSSRSFGYCVRAVMDGKLRTGVDRDDVLSMGPCEAARFNKWKELERDLMNE
ncbi:hypothetical protein D9757_001139 [Collybiopsis confluens]|uniref:Uncharacterized protein n=1 Tax=Collybiopsis confluens TaxID=2823264 RepID=A0A8H5MG16_9AGAR|nr:hypothetical protein D9757_001139 [Collybiopsis confluens]